MALTAGTHLGPYEVAALIGKGGMGEVYKARDTRLDRTVAVKVLPSHVASDPDRKQRFEREAKTLAALSHPHICPVFDVGQQDGIGFLVMEYLEGQTLAQRLETSALPLDQTLQYAIQIADALDKAHRKGVVHRDLKPGNIMLTKGGTKLLDFGLAKLSGTPTSALAGASALPTQESLTAHGTILGTFQYMAPEQVEGKEADTRSDIFTFGAIVYEMATGKRAFEGKSAASVMAAILEREPPAMSSLQPLTTPPLLEHVVRRCLAKDPDERWQSASDVMRELRWIAGQNAQPATSAPVRSHSFVGIPSAGRRAIALGFVCVLAGSALMGFVVWRLRPAPPPQPVSRMVIPLPPNEQLRGAVAPMLALSPDGTRLVYIAGTGAQGRMYVRALDSMEASLIAGTEGALNPFFSPDGQWIGFVAAGKLKKVSISGGAVLTLCDDAAPFGATWGANDTIVFTPTGEPGLFMVSAAGGEPQPLTNLVEETESGHRWPQFLPDGKTILYTYSVGVGTADEGYIAAHRLDTGEKRVLIRGGTFPRYVPTGHLVYYRRGTIMGAPFDTDRLEMGTPAPVVEDVMSSAGPAGGGGAAQFSFSFSALGSLVYLRGGPQSGQRTLVWVDREGTEVPLPAPSRSYDDLSLSPDGRQVAVQILEPPPASVWIYDIPRGTLTRLTSEANHTVWTPDGKRIVFAGSTPRASGLFWQPADGSGPAELVMTSALPLPGPTSVSPDGHTLAFFTRASPGTGADLWVVPLHGERKSRPFLQSPFFEVDPMFSPNGHWLAYTSNESGRSEVYVQPYPGPGRKWLISTEGGAEPLWSPNGREVFYRNDDRMMAVDIQTQPAFKAGTPRMLFDKPGYFGGAGPDHDISPDGQRFLMIKQTEQRETALTQINVVLNWHEELKRLVPTK